MNAPLKFDSATATVDEAASNPFPNSRKVYVEGSRPDIRVPMREISQADTPASFGGEPNPPSMSTTPPVPTPTRTPRSTSAPACRHARMPWIAERGDTEELTGPTSAYGANAWPIRRWPSCASTCTASRAAPCAGAQRHADALRAQGIITPEMEFVAIRENLRRQEYLENLKNSGPMGQRWPR
jgi:phosphomethylpyrimidine synthase